MSVKVTNQNTPTATTDQLLIVEAFDGTPTPNGRLRQGVYYSFQNTWRNFTEKLGLDRIFTPLTRTITINGTTKSLEQNIDFTVSGSGATWGSITGTLSDQTDLKSALDAREVLTNKSTDVATDKTSDIKYPSVKAVFDWASSVFTTTSAVATQITTALIGYATEAFVNAGLLTKQTRPFAQAVNTSINIASATAVQIHSKALTDIAIGDTIQVRIVGNLLNNSGGARTYTHYLQFGSLILTIVDGASIAASATNESVHEIEATICVAASNFTSIYGELDRGVASAIDTGQSITVNTIRKGFNESTSDLTGSQTFTYSVLSTGGATATQTFKLRTAIITILKSNP